MDQYTGKKLGNFEVIELIGQGGMAAVYRGFQPSMNRDVAIKIMFPQYSSDEAFVARFKNEAHLIAALQHAHILPVIDFGDEDGTLYIAMRYLDSGTLKERIPKEGMPLKEAHRLFVQIASALDYGHSKGIVHRDLKPANILVDDQNNAYLTDFGIAKMLGSDQDLTGTGGIVGTPSYMSPEQGMGMTIDHRTDLYALGVMLFHMLTGQLPFDADTGMALMIKHMNEEVPVPSSVRADLTPGLDAVIMKALEKEPDDRYQTGRELIDALDEAMASAMGMGTESLRTVAADARAAAIEAAKHPVPMGVTAVAGQRVPTMPAVPDITIAPTIVTSWVSDKARTLDLWLRAVGLSLATFIILQRIAPGSVIETLGLSLIPGVLLYGLLRAATLGGLSAFVLILIPLLVLAPGVGILWAILTIVAGSRLHSREMLLILLTAALAGLPVGIVLPLIVPWYFRARRSVLALATGVAIAILFAATLGWPTGGGLLPHTQRSAPEIVTGAADANYLSLFEPESFPSGEDVLASLGATLAVASDVLTTGGGSVIFVVIGWALAALMSVSNRRVENSKLRASGVIAGALLLFLVHSPLVSRGTSLGWPLLIVFTLVSGGLAYGLTQWPLQADPNKGNLPATVQRLLTQALGALFMALGVSVIVRNLPDTAFADVLVLLAFTGVIWTLVSPLYGTLLVFIAWLVGTAPVAISLDPVGVELAQDNLGAAGVVFALTIVYLAVNLIFDRRRPRRWNPLGAGGIIGAPQLAGGGLLVFPAISMGLLEAQVPATIFALAMHVALWLTGGFPGGLGLVVQVVGAVVAVILPTRLMDTPLLGGFSKKVRRGGLAALTMLVLFPVYYTAGGAELARSGTFVGAYIINVLLVVWLIVAMGDAASVWVSELDADQDREAEDDYAQVDVDTMSR